MVTVDVGVSQYMDELSSLQAADLGEHAGEQRVAGNVEGDTETHIAGSLIHLTAESAIASDVELSQNVARRQGHDG
jgi:hypothetical protein